MDTRLQNVSAEGTAQQTVVEDVDEDKGDCQVLRPEDDQLYHGIGRILDLLVLRHLHAQLDLEALRRCHGRVHALHKGVHHLVVHARVLVLIDQVQEVFSFQLPSQIVFGLEADLALSLADGEVFFLYELQLSLHVESLEAARYSELVEKPRLDVGVDVVLDRVDDGLHDGHVADRGGR